MANTIEILKRLNQGNSPLFQELYGTDTEIIKQQHVRYETLINEFRKNFGESEIELFSAPGRTEIGGNHTDHNHGRVLAGAVNLDNIAVAAKNNSNTIEIKSIGYPAFKVDLNDLSPKKEEQYSSTALVKGIVARFRELGYETGGFNMCNHSLVPKGSGLSSSAAFEVLVGAVINHLFNNGKIDAVENAKTGQWAENNYFGKPCGLMDQTACSVGGLITIDFKNPSKPIVKEIDFNFLKSGYSLVITDVGGGHHDAASQEEYASLPIEMKKVAVELGANVLRDVTLEQIIENIPQLREKTGDRAILRAFHFQGDNLRVVKQVEALEANNFDAFLKMVIESGQSSYMYNQNIYNITQKNEQVVSLALALSEMILKDKGAWRVHGGGFGGTIQAFVPDTITEKYISTVEHVYGKGHCHKLFIRKKGAVKLDI